MLTYFVYVLRHSYWFIKDLIFLTLSGCFPIFSCFSTAAIHTENTYHHWLLYLLSFCFLRSTTIQTFLMAILEQFVDRVKRKIATFHRLFQTHLIPVQKRIKNLFNHFFCLNTNHETPLRMHQALFIALIWWHEVIFRC